LVSCCFYAPQKGVPSAHGRGEIMQWYWWVLIGIAVVAIIVLKTKLAKAFLKNWKEKQQTREKLLEEDE